jgi:AbrB family looped-hinge helix DNA binding protein
MPVSRLTYKYQATIPRQVREVLSLGAGDRVEFILEGGGLVRLRKAPAVDPEIAALEAALAPEWDSPEDDAAYAEL